MRVRILRLPGGTDPALEGFDLAPYEIGKVYNINARVAELLIVCGYAAPEMRQTVPGAAPVADRRRPRPS